MISQDSRRQVRAAISKLSAVAIQEPQEAHLLMPIIAELRDICLDFGESLEAGIPDDINAHSV